MLSALGAMAREGEELTFELAIKDLSRGITISRELVELLKGIRKERSLARAAEKLGMSYRHAWGLVVELERALGQAVVVTIRGGAGGGRSELTAAGEEIVERYERFVSAVEEAFRREVLESDIVIKGSHCVGVDLLVRLLKGKSPGVRVHVASVGSEAGLAAVARGETDIAGIHIYDAETGTYNVEAVKSARSRGAVALVRGYVREVGLVVKKGNPRGLKSFRDVVEKGARFVNRTRGSGTRMLVERLLDDLAAELGAAPSHVREMVTGYEKEVKTHVDVALAVLRGDADVGVAIRAVADRYGLGFVPIARENFDFAVARASLSKEYVKLFLELLASDEFREAARSVSGIWVSEETGEFIVP